MKGFLTFFVAMVLAGCVDRTPPECQHDGRWMCIDHSYYGWMRDGRAVTEEGKAKQKRYEEELEREVEEKRKITEKADEQNRARRAVLAKQESDHQEAERARIAARSYKHVGSVRNFVCPKSRLNFTASSN